MIVSWNIRGLNKRAKLREISSRLYSLQLDVAILLETHVKQDNTGNCRKRLGNNWSYIDNYAHHANGRIWFMWDDTKVHIKEVKKTDQMIHCEMYSCRGVFLN